MNKTLLLKLSAITSFGFFIGGCASMFSGQSQPVKVTAISKAPLESDIKCHMQNGRGSWITSLNESTFIMRDNKPLQISCYNREQELVGQTSIEPYYNKTNLWNIPLTLIPAAGIAGWVYDGTNGTANEYPGAITINMNNQKIKK